MKFRNQEREWDTELFTKVYYSLPTTLVSQGTEQICVECQSKSRQHTRNTSCYMHSQKC
jgi:hypothetical protein